MIHDEKTIEIEIHPKKEASPPFRRRASDNLVPDAKASAVAVTSTHPSKPSLRWDNLEISNPWLLRLAAVFIILALSFFVI